MQNISRLLAIMEKLRDPQGGCPWDLQQTYKTIVPHTLEEAYEVADTIERQQYDELRDELGDLLFQIVFYAQLAKEEQRFEFDDVVEAICDKLERRHPHVFGDVSYDNAEEQTAAWEALKKQERANKQVQQKSSVLNGITQNLPAISLAQKIQQRVARVGFDWPDWHGVLDKVIEETDEVRNAWANAQARQEEIGDLLFACINLARHADCDAEASLRHANRKFTERFQQLESLAEQEGIVLEHASLDTLEALWKRAKSATE